MLYPIYKDKGIEKHKIASYQMDLKGQATLPVICNYFQEIAGNHAHANNFGFNQMIKNGHIWVLTRLRVEINEYPKWNDNIFIKTWVRNRKSLFSERDFLVMDKDEKELGGALSGWMLLDLKSRRPKKVDNFPISIEMYPNEHAITKQLKKIAPVEQTDFSYSKTAEFQDIDVNQHVNNVKYIEWFLSAFPYEFRKRKNVKAIEINYLAEMKHGDSVDIKSHKIKDDIYILSMVNTETKKEICRAEIEWIDIS